MRKLLFLILLGFSIASHAQYFEAPQQSGIGIPFFDIEIFRTFAKQPGLTRMHVFSRILYDDLTFIKTDSNDTYHAELEIVVAIYDDKGISIASKTDKKEVNEQDYEITNSRQETVMIAEYFDLEAGEYELKVQMDDIISKKATNRKLEFEVGDYQKEELAISDLLFLDKIYEDSTGSISEALPSIGANFTKKNNDFYVQFDLYSEQVPASINIKYILENDKQEQDWDTTLVKEVKNQISSHIFKFDQRVLKRNRYNCIVEVKSEEGKVKNNRWFSFYWIDLPETSSDITAAINQMRYILRGDSLDKYMDASFDEQQAFFERYWATRDPNPNTSVNELMREYFGRVNYANREYSTFSLEGWLTDRGRILIKFGFPDDIERHPFELDSIPYVIWRYYSLRKIFVFADRSGFGDYRLLPEYMNQEY